MVVQELCCMDTGTLSGINTDTGSRYTIFQNSKVWVCKYKFWNICTRKVQSSGGGCNNLEMGGWDPKLNEMWQWENGCD